jgi:hypothetical protein
MRLCAIPDPLTFPDFPNLFVVPYVHGRLMFAQAAAHAVQTLQPDMLAVDLPLYLNKSRLLDAALQAFPLASALFVSHPSHGIRYLPFVVTDAPMLAAHQARARNISFECIDEGLDPEPLLCAGDAGLPDDWELSQMSLHSYFDEAWGERGPDAGARQNNPAFAGRIACRLQRLMDGRRRILFVCEWKRWRWVGKMLGSAEPFENPDPLQAPAALIFEDPQQLWNCGFMDDFPALNLRFFRHVQAGITEQFHKRSQLLALLRRHGCAGMKLPSGTPRAAMGVLERSEALYGHEAVTRLAKSLLDYPMPTLEHATGHLPAFSAIKNDHIEEEPAAAFTLPDSAHVIPYYPLSAAEKESFYAGPELEQRKFWGPDSAPWISRMEAKIPSPSFMDCRWSVPQNFSFYARVGKILRQSVREATLDPPLEGLLDEFTPVVFILRLESDNDVRSVEETNATARRRQLGLEWDHDEDPKPDVIHTLLATRRAVVPYGPRDACYDDASSIALLYSGPEEPGPDRYAAVARRLQRDQMNRTLPGNDSELRPFPPLQVCAAWAVRWAPAGIVLIAACDRWEPSEDLLKLAEKRSVRMILQPLSVIPRELMTRLRRRVFVSKTVRFHSEGELLMTRLAQWRI